MFIVFVLPVFFRNYCLGNFQYEGNIFVAIIPRDPRGSLWGPRVRISADLGLEDPPLGSRSGAQGSQGCDPVAVPWDPRGVSWTRWASWEPIGPM